jgi:putative membrane protein
MEEDIRTDLAKERNRLAAERTFSAWLRTGLAGVGGGVAIMKFLSFTHETHEILAHIIGQMLVLWGILIFIFALTGYYVTCKRLDEKLPSRVFTLGITLIALSLMAFSIVILVITKD